MEYFVVAFVVAVVLFVVYQEVRRRKRRKPKPVRRPRTFVGYGLVSVWRELVMQGRDGELADALRDAGLNFTELEYVYDFPDKPWGSTTRTDIEALVRFVTAMRERDITTKIVIVNWNSEAQRRASDQWFEDQVRNIRQRLGPSVLVEPVAEPWVAPDSKTKRWYEITARYFGFDELVTNDRSVFNGAKWSCWHHCNWDRMKFQLRRGDPNTIHDTDCTPLVGNNLSPAQAEEMAYLATKHGTNVVIFDDREDTNFRRDLIEAMGRGVRRALDETGK